MKLISEILEFSILVLKEIFTSRKEGVITRITKSQTKAMATFDFKFEVVLLRNWGAQTDNALLNAIKDNAIQSTYANTYANDIDNIHQNLPKFQEKPRYTLA